MQIVEQLSFQDVDENYKAFVDKFKPKKTTDDCYTPDNIYEAVLEWAMKEYGFKREQVVRPFWPGGDYERFDYPENCVVLDNPPFSIISKICAQYGRHGIKFFLFAPYLTNFSSQTKGVCHIITDSNITYENGAEVNTAFLTNLEPGVEIRTAPELRRAIVEADNINRRQGRPSLPKYTYPPEVLTATMVGYFSKYGIDFKVMSSECRFIRVLESQKKKGKSIFGSGYLISKKAAAEKAAAEKAAKESVLCYVWELSEGERQIVESLGG